MNAHTQNTTEENSGHDPGTPVIVKTGSNGPPGSNKVEVIIDSQYIPFTEFVSEAAKKVWKSHSIRKGRIHKLSIFEGAELKDNKKQLYPQELASIKIEYGPTYSLDLRELGNTADQDVVLEITSVGAPFKAETPGEWNIATGLFPPPTRVVFRGGNEEIINHEFTNPTLIIEFPEPTVG